MYILTVIPISKGITKDYLSYFTSSSLRPGALIKVPLRNKSTHALVLSSKNASEFKTEIRSANFALKKIETISGRQCLPPGFLDAVFNLSDYYGVAPGALLHSLLPQTILSSIEKTKAISTIYKKSKGSTEKLILQTDTESRLTSYRSLIREEFAKKHSVIICVPTIEDVFFLGKELCRGVEEYSYLLGSFLSKEKMITSWNSIALNEHPVLIIGTPQFLSVPRQDVGIIVVEKESSPFYKTLQRPFIDMRKVAEEVAEAKAARILFGDTLLSVETIWRYNQGELSEISPVKLRLVRKADFVLIDRQTPVSKKGTDEAKEEQQRALSKEALALIKHSFDNKERIFVLCNKKGISPATYCGDCGMQVICKNCSAPVVLHEYTNSNRFLCHKCGTSRDATEVCTRCGSWNLKTFGAGIEKVLKEIEANFPEIKILRIDSDSVKTRTKVLSVISEFYKNQGSVLVGTDMALHYLHRQYENTLVVTMDNLFGISDFKIHEKIMGTLSELVALTQKFLLVQSRIPDHPLFSYIKSGNLGDFYREEIADRKKWKYPPFSVFIKISLSGDRKEAQDILQNIKNTLPMFESDIFFSPFSDLKGKPISNLLIRIPREKWPDKICIEVLKTLPPQCAVRINPEQVI